MFFAPTVEDGYPVLKLDNPDDYEVFLSLDGTPRLPGWKPIRVKLSAMFDEQDSFKPSDFPWIGEHALVLSSAAVVSLRHLIAPFGELLPLTTSGEGKLHVLNVKTIDALDEARSSIMRFPSSNRIMTVTRPVLRSERLHGIDIFRLPHRAGSTYVSDRFVDVVRDAGLRGLTFSPVESVP